MAASAIRILQEDQREQYADDAKYYQEYVYYFELRVPPRLTADGEGAFIFPLILAPESYELDEPFTVEGTPTQGGGYYTEENGIVQRTIRLSGTTGFKPRRLPNISSTSLVALKGEKKSYSRSLTTNILWPLSGQRHFHYLQDAVFRTYADLKRDPSTSEETRLIFHVPKDEESWLVVPRRFSLKRSKEDRVLYRYEIELTAVDKAEARVQNESEDKNLLDTIKDAVKTVQSGISLAKGAVNDVTQLASELVGLVKNIENIIDDVTSIVTASEAFVNGVTDIIELPFDVCNSVANTIEESLAFANTTEEAIEDIRRLPDNVINKFRTIVDGVDRIAMHPEVFETRAATELAALKQAEELLTSISFERKIEAQEATAPTTLAESAALGTALTPGDITSAESELGVGRAFNEYTGATLRTVQSGDTLISLAARYLGDARLWQHIAAANGLKPPFVTEQARLDLTSERSPFAGAIGVGMELLIPNYSKAPQDLPLLPVLAVQPEEDPEVHLLGTDVAIVRLGGRDGAPLYGIAIDVEGRSQGPKLVRGRDNLAQAVLLRSIIERGSDVLYKNLGLGRVVGSKLLFADVAAARYKMIESLSQDSRISSVRKITFDNNQADTLAFDAELEVRGFTQTSNVQVTL